MVTVSPTFRLAVASNIMVIKFKAPKAFVLPEMLFDRNLGSITDILVTVPNETLPTWPALSEASTVGATEGRTLSLF